ncbi:hypothetical protein K438DRAFT_2057361 [Mycena galopus ATCC 62051]|nr:hypothetical protein K438DRAFT_2057361 [Mycena galopus ATCC 62051]
MPAELHSIYDLTTFCRKTTGDVPAKLVGASTTVVGSKMYLFGGRLVTERRMVADLYVFDLETYNWEKIPPFPEDDVPRARYFHSVDTWNNQLIVFGGMSNQPDSPNPDELCVLNDVRFFDIATRHWLPPSRLPSPENLMPRARYAQLSSVTGDRLFIIGGQDFYNTWLDDVCVYDLLAKTWSERRDYPRHCGSYRSVAVSSNQCVRFPKDEMRVSPSGTRFTDAPSEDTTPPDSLTHLPYSAAPTDEYPSDIYLYIHRRQTRARAILAPPRHGLHHPRPLRRHVRHDLPPGLRFPTGAILGTHLIIAGIYLAHSYQSFSIWVLDLTTMVWSRIDPGKAVEAGSWFRGCLWPEANKFMIFGNRNGNLVDDYNRRLLSWDHVAVVDLEAFGIYQPPPLKLDIPMQELGLAALEEGVLADFELVCDDGRKIPCSRKLLEERWPWFKEQKVRLLQSAMGAIEALPNSPMHIPLPELPGNVPDEQRPDPRLTPRAFNLSEPYPITLALLQYFYSLALLTPLQTAPAVLSQLLVLATNYNISHLQTLVRHAMHRALSNSTSVGVYEVATLCSCRSLQIRALKTVMSYTQKKPSRSKPERDGGGGSGGGRGDGGPGGGPSNGNGRDGRDGGRDGGGGGEGKYSSTRPRGTSDARWATSTNDSGTRGYSNYGTGSGNQRSGGGYERLDELEEHEHLFSLPPSGYTNYASPRRYFEMDEDVDQLFTLPVFTKARSHRRTDSAVSAHTENEINELVEFMATSPISPSFPGASRAPSAALRESKTDQMIMDDMYHALMGPQQNPYRQSHMSGLSAVSSDDADESSYYPATGSSRASMSGHESESESGFDSSAPTSPSVIAYHLPRRPSLLDTSADASPSLSRAGSVSGRRSAASIDTLMSGSGSGTGTPSLMSSVSSSSRSSIATRHDSYPVTPPHSPDWLPSIKERYARDESDADDGGDDIRGTEDGDEFERRALGMGMYSGAPGRPAAVPRTSSGNPWPTQKSRVEWIVSTKAPSVFIYNGGVEADELSPSPTQTQFKAESEIVLEPREPRKAPAVKAATTATATTTPPNRTRALSPTPSDAETLSPRATTSVFSAAREVLKKKSVDTAKSMSPKSPLSPLSPLSPASSGFFMDPKESKAAKAEEKRRKKEASKARMEELARTLKERTKKAKEDVDKHSQKSREARAEPVTMFGGIAGVTM